MNKALLSLFILLILGLTIVTFFVWNDPLHLAAVEMLWSLVIFWVIICGSVMYFYKDKFVKFYARISWPFWLKFAAFSTIFSLIEELIAVSITNYFYSLTNGVVKLTASANYWEVVSRHSVIVFIPFFLLIGFTIQRFNLTPFNTFLVWGTIGTLAEASISGYLGLLQFPLWIFVYGLMVYLPTQRS